MEIQGRYILMAPFVLVSYYFIGAYFYSNIPIWIGYCDPCFYIYAGFGIFVYMLITASIVRNVYGEFGADILSHPMFIIFNPWMIPLILLWNSVVLAKRLIIKTYAWADKHLTVKL